MTIRATYNMNNLTFNLYFKMLAKYMEFGEFQVQFSESSVRGGILTQM